MNDTGREKLIHLSPSGLVKQPTMKLHGFSSLISLPLLVNSQAFDFFRVGTVILEGEVGYVPGLSAEELGVLNRPFMVHSYGVC